VPPWLVGWIREELNAFGCLPGVPYPHEEPFERARAYDQTSWERVLLDEERVVAAGLEALREAAAVVGDGCWPPVDGSRSGDDLAGVSGHDDLAAEADAERWRGVAAAAGDNDTGVGAGSCAARK
jgi:hypothetical protein